MRSALKYNLILKLLYSSEPDARVKLVEYIYEHNGAELKRIDFNDAAKTLNVSRRTIGRYVDSLVTLNLITASPQGVQLNEEILNDLLN